MKKNIQLFKALSEDTRYRIIKTLFEAERKYKVNESDDCKGELCAARSLNSLVEHSTIPQYTLQNCRIGE